MEPIKNKENVSIFEMTIEDILISKGFEISLKTIFLLAVLVGFLTALNYGILSEEKRIITNKKDVTNIFSLKSNSNTSGNFFLGIGTIGKTDYYVFLQKDIKFNGFTKEKVPVDGTLLVESDKNPSVTKNYQIVQSITTPYFFGEKENRIDTIQFGIFDEIPKSIKYRYIITIPKGTVTEKQTYEPL